MRKRSRAGMRCGTMPWREEPGGPGSRSDYYQAEMLTMITINRESNRALLLVAQAMQDDAGRRYGEGAGETAEALEALDAIQNR